MQSFRVRLNRFVRSFVTLDLRTDEETRRIRCERFALKNKTCGKPATFAIGPKCNVEKLYYRDPRAPLALAA